MIPLMPKKTKSEILDEPGAEARFMSGVRKALETPPKPFTPVKNKPKKGRSTKEKQHT